MDYEMVIGMEVHAQLKTKSKMFCGCSTSFGDKPNNNTCPVCLGLPGVLPVINRKAVEFVIKTGIAFHCEIARYSVFARKNYYYPDLPKNYQISQYEIPLCRNGYLQIDSGKKIIIRRIHLEEDTGKLIHFGGRNSAIDYNRCGVPLMEIVTEPDINSTEEAYQYLTKLRNILQYLDVCDGNMEEGSLRCEPNISVRKVGNLEFGVKTELKNINSFKAVTKGLEFEFSRQKKLLDKVEKIIQETRRWDEEKEQTFSMRSKEEAHDYRYFPEPDLAPMIIKDEEIDIISKNIPELMNEKKERFINEFLLSEYDARILTLSKDIADYFEGVLKIYSHPKIVCNWVTNELLRLLNLENKSISECKVKPEDLAQMLEAIDNKIVSGKIAKVVFEEMFISGKKSEDIIKEKKLVQILDEDVLKEIIQKAIEENPKTVEEYKSGKEKALGFLVGCVMKKTEGKANPQIVNKLLKEMLP